MIFFFFFGGDDAGAESYCGEGDNAAFLGWIIACYCFSGSLFPFSSLAYIPGRVRA